VRTADHEIVADGIQSGRRDGEEIREFAEEKLKKDVSGDSSSRQSDIIKLNDALRLVDALKLSDAAGRCDANKQSGGRVTDAVSKLSDAADKIATAAEKIVIIDSPPGRSVAAGSIDKSSSQAIDKSADDSKPSCKKKCVCELEEPSETFYTCYYPVGHCHFHEPKKNSTKPKPKFYCPRPYDCGCYHDYHHNYLPVPSPCNTLPKKDDTYPCHYCGGYHRNHDVCPFRNHDGDCDDWDDHHHNCKHHRTGFGFLCQRWKGGIPKCKCKKVETKPDSDERCNCEICLRHRNCHNYYRPCHNTCFYDDPLYY
jgi:hypothetical protein